MSALIKIIQHTWLLSDFARTDRPCSGGEHDPDSVALCTKRYPYTLSAGTMTRRGALVRSMVANRWWYAHASQPTLTTR